MLLRTLLFTMRGCDVPLGKDSLVAAGTDNEEVTLRVLKATTKDVDFHWQHLADDGLRLVCRILCRDQLIQHIDLSMNYITPAGVPAIQDMLAVNQTLTSLKLAGNQISDEGCACIADGMELNTTLTSLDLRDCEVRRHAFA